MNRFFLLSVLFIGTILPGFTYSQLRMPAVFSDGMVLQQETEVLFWGWAGAGEKVNLSAGWSSNAYHATADKQGKWKIKLKTPSAGGPYTVKINAGASIEIKDVLLGEVWLCSGQSNMVFSLKGSEGAKEEIAKADNPLVRYFSVKRQYGLKEFEDCPGSVWEKTTPATAGSFSAVAYYFAKRIAQDKKVPVGIVYTAWGGTPAEAWTPRELIEKDTLLHRYIDRWSDIQQNVGKDSAQYHVALNEWDEKRLTADSNKIKKPAEPQTLYYFNRPWREPAVLFNGMVDPVIPYAIKGILWYQGESNVSYPDEYDHLFGAMIESWRRRWKDAGYSSKLPFYFVQLAAYGYDRMDAAARLREAQENVSKRVPNTGMAVTLDLGNMNDIHYIRKREVGERLALIALSQAYDQKRIVYKGPQLKNIKSDHGGLSLQFTGSELRAKHDSVGGFEIGYRDPASDSIVFVNAKAEIRNNRVLVYNAAVPKPIAVRYGWLRCGDADLFNKEGLPAVPFRKVLGFGF